MKPRLPVLNARRAGAPAVDAAQAIVAPAERCQLGVPWVAVVSDGPRLALGFASAMVEGARAQGRSVFLLYDDQLALEFETAGVVAFAGARGVCGVATLPDSAREALVGCDQGALVVGLGWPLHLHFEASLSVEVLSRGQGRSARHVSWAPASDLQVPGDSEALARRLGAALAHVLGGRELEPTLDTARSWS